MRIRIVLTVACLPLLAGCAGTNFLSQDANKPATTAPHLVDFSTKMKDTLNKSSAWMVSGLVSRAVDTVQGLPMIAVAGRDLSSNQDSVWNDGKAFTGLKVVVQGNAFSQGILGQPKPVSVSVRSETGKDIIARGSGSFVMSGYYVYTAVVPYVQCDKIIEVEFSAPALKEGDSDYQVLVSPMDSSASAVTFRHSCSIAEPYSMRYAERRNLPDATTSTTGQTPSEPKTQYELGLRQIEAEKNR